MLDALSAFIVSRLKDAILRQGQAVLAVSGGRTPRALFEKLSAVEMPWREVSVILVDERAVAIGHPLSNTALVRDSLTRDRAKDADLRAFVPDGMGRVDDLSQLVAAANDCIRDLPAISLAILGIGSDGHFASIFAGMANFESAVTRGANAAYVPVRLESPPAEAPVDRITLTLPKLLEAGDLVLPVSGDLKRAALRRALQGQDPAWPASLLVAQAGARLHIWLEGEDDV